MQLDRRALFAGLTGAGLMAAAPAAAQTPPPPAPAPKPTLEQRQAARILENRHAVTFTADAVAGPGFDLLVREGGAAQFFALGEEHGIAQVPLLSRQLMLALKGAGFSRLALEISPPFAVHLDQATRQGLPGIRALYAQTPPGPAFYSLAEEAAFIAAVRAALPGPGPVLLGLDYEVLVDRYLISRLKPKVPPAARAAFAALETASLESWAKFEQTRNPQFIFAFNGDPALVAAIQAAWPRPDPASDEILRTLHATLAINQHETTGRYFQANDTRARFMRDNFVRFWRAERTAGRAPKTFFKFGAGHMVRGRSMTEVYDIGSLLSETATLEGGHSFHLLVVPAPGGHQAALNPSTMTADDVVAETFPEMALELFAPHLFADSSTLVDLRPLRSLMSASVTRTTDPRLARVVHGFDAVLVIKDSAASKML